MLRPHDWAGLRHTIPLLATLPDAVTRHARVVVVGRDQFLFRRGDRPLVMNFVLSGEVHLVRRTVTGSELVLQRARGGFVAEASFDQPTYHCDAIAVTDCRLLVFGRRHFQKALGDEAFRNWWIAHLARELRRVRAQAERLSLKSAPERIIHYIETEGTAGSIILNRSKKKWAGELGLTHEALYRTLARMSQAGLLVIDGSRLTLPR